MARLDPHSYVDGDQPRPQRFRMKLAVAFDRQRLAGEAALSFAAPVSGMLDLDTKGLDIHEVRSEAGEAVPFELDPEEPVLGRRLRLPLPADTREVTIRYETAPDALGLQWLAPAQTAGGRHPFLFSQCQSIHARTMAPLPDSPRVRMSYEAAVTVPEGLAAVMSAGPAGDSPGSAAETRTFRFEMPQPIPSYLLALAVGRLESRDLSARSRVWAEPETLPAAAHEFAEIERMISRAEA
ncbi:MAG: M1 family peptidase, partial [Candidatus Rokubacteria bacterium]|nr:M1 family peptidase [Candidatus Rokubacteria bacterium]